MARADEIKKLNRELAELEKKYKSLNRISPFKGKDAQEVAKQYGSIAKATKEVETSMAGIRADILEMESGLDGLKSIFADIGKELGDMDNPIKEATKSFKKLRNFAEDLSDIQYDLASSSLKETKSLKVKVNLEFNRLQRQTESLKTQIASGKLSGKELSDAQELLAISIDKQKSLENQIGYQGDFNKALDVTIKRQKRISSATGLTGKAIKGLAGFAEKIGFGDMSDDLDIITAQMKDQAVALTDNGKKAAGLSGQFKIMGTGLKGLGKSLLSALTDPLIIIGLIVKAVKELFSIFGSTLKKVNDVGQAFGVAGANAKYLKNQIHAAGDASKNIFYFTEELLGAQKELNDVAGVTLKFNEANAKAFQDLTLYAGYSAEQIKALTKLSYEAGVPLMDMEKAVVGTLNAANESTGIYLDQNAIFNQLQGASANVRFNIKGGTEGLVKAAHTAARLGTTMDEIAAASKSHLDFESSISKEIEAEMFLQKDLNLDKLRHAAATGDTATQAAEQLRLITENKSALEGNVFAQEAFAGMLGISQEKLTEMMLGEKKLKNIKEDQLKIDKDTGREMSDQGKKAVEFDRSLQSAVKQLKAALEPIAMKLGPLIISLVKKIGPIIESTIDFLKSGAGKMLLGLGAGFLAIKGTVGLVKGVKNLFTKGFGSIMKRGSNPLNPMWVEDATGSGGGGGGYGGGGGGGGNNRTNKSKGVTFDKKTNRYRNSKGQFVKKPKGFKPPKTKFKMKGRGLMGLLALGGGMLLANNLFGGEDSEGVDEYGNPIEGGGMDNSSMMAGAGISAMDMGLMGTEAGADALTGNMGNKSPKPKPPPKPKPKPSGGFFSGLMDKAKSAYSGAKSMASNAYSGAKGMASSAYSSASNVYQGARGMADNAYQGVKGAVVNSSAYKGVKSGVNAMADFSGQAKKWLGSKIPTIFPKILGTIKKPLKGILSKIPLVGSILELLFTGMDVNSIAKSKDMSPQEMYAAMGSSVISGGLGLTMGSLAAAGVSSLQAVGIPGWLLSGAAYMGGDWLGRTLGGAISDYVGGPTIGKSIFDLFYADKGSAKGDDPVMMASGGMVTSATSAIVGEAGPEAVIPLTEFYAKFDELIKAVNTQGTVYLDGVKVGHVLALQSSKLG